MILAAPLVIPFAKAVGLSVGTLGMAALADKVNDYIETNPEESSMILKTLIPNLGIGEIFMNKEKISIEDLDEMSDQEAADLPTDIKADLMKQGGKSRGGNKRELMKELSKKLGLSGPGKKQKDMEYDADERYEGGVEEKADGGAIGIEVLFEEKNPRQGLFMGGSPLDGQALAIYNSMKAYDFTDQQIADALAAQGLYTPGGSTPDTPDTTIQPIGFQSDNGGGGGITELDPLNRPKGTPFDLNSLTKTKFGYNNALGRTIEGVKDFTGSMIDKFSGSKIGEGITSGATKFKNMAFTPMMALMQKRNPLNPNAMNYNPNLQKQMDFLEGTTGTRVFGTSDNLQFEDAAMIGRDPNSGLAKYGPGSVVSGQNVVSGFGTNDYEQQLANYVEKMRTRAITKTLSKFQQQKLEAAMAELGREKARQEKDAADKARAANADVYAELDKRTGGKGYGDAGGFSTSRAGKEGAFGTFGEGRGRKDFSEGGLATMFKEKR